MRFELFFIKPTFKKAGIVTLFVPLIIMIVSTGDIADKKYEIMDIVFAFGTPENKLFKTNNPLEAFPKVKEELIRVAQEMGADAVIHSCFNYRDAVRQGCGSNSTVIEVFGYGTAVKFK